MGDVGRVVGVLSPEGGCVLLGLLPLRLVVWLAGGSLRHAPKIHHWWGVSTQKFWQHGSNEVTLKEK